MKKRLLITLSLSAIMVLVTVGLSGQEVQDVIIDSEECNINGYKTWKGKSIFGGNVNFYDCQCTYHKGRPQTACSS